MSTIIARTFLDAYTIAHSAETIETMDVWNMSLPEFDGDTIEAKYAALHGQERTPAKAVAWKELSALARRVREADKLVFAVPMWNFGIPHKLRHFIDVISKNDSLFTFDEKGFSGMVTAEKAAIIYARGIDYGP